MRVSMKITTVGRSLPKFRGNHGPQNGSSIFLFPSHISSKIDLLFYPEGGSRFVRNVGNDILQHTE
jgi:hypothetical protein